MRSYELRDKLFVKKWNEASQSVDVPYKQWVRIGFSWCWDVCSEINKQLDNDNESYSRMIKRLDDKLEQRENELAEYKLDLFEAVNCLEHLYNLDVIPLKYHKDLYERAAKILGKHKPKGEL